MKDHTKELKAAGRRGSRADKAAQAEQDVLAKIAEMRPSDRVMAGRVHAVVKTNTPVLEPKPWYGMPAYALDGSTPTRSRAGAPVLRCRPRWSGRPPRGRPPGPRRTPRGLRTSVRCSTS